MTEGRLVGEADRLVLVADARMGSGVAVIWVGWEVFSRIEVAVGAVEVGRAGATGVFVGGIWMGLTTICVWVG